MVEITCICTESLREDEVRSAADCWAFIYGCAEIICAESLWEDEVRFPQPIVGDRAS